MDVIILTGQSGAGKSTALHVFEDMRHCTADGVPPLLLPEMARLLLASPAQPQGVALGVEQRRNGFAEDLSAALDALKGLGLTPNLLFLRCETSELMRRYATTRRPHPLERAGVGLAQAIHEEMDALAPIARMADAVIDTSTFSIHDLRREIQRRCEMLPAFAHAMKVNLISFGFKYGVPREADLVFDLRFLPNPYFVEALRPHSGMDQIIRDYVFGTPEARQFRARFLDFLTYSLPLYDAEGRYRLTIALGCTGGRHRSVAMTEELATLLKQEQYTVSTEHRHMNLG